MTKPVLSRREFAIVAAAAGGSMMLPKAESHAAATNSAAKLSIETFNDGSVKLGGGRWKTQYEQAREFYFGVSNDDILHGFRAEADLPAPGKPLGGWAARNSGGIFGQWLSGMSRMYRYTGDEAIRDKAIVLFTEWAKTVGADGNCRMRHYPFEKLVCGLVDLKRYAGHDEAIPVLAKVTDWASKTFDRERARRRRGRRKCIRASHWSGTRCRKTCSALLKPAATSDSNRLPRFGSIRPIGTNSPKLPIRQMHTACMRTAT